MRQLLLNIFPPPKPNFANFITGNNAEMLASLLQWLPSDSHKSPEAPLTDTGFYLFGQPGSGKTHLLKASGLTYLNAALDPALNQVEEPINRLAIDNIQRLNASGQQNLFNLFNRLHADTAHGKHPKLLLSGDTSPQQLNFP